MARLTKAQREIVEAEHQARAIAEYVAAYPARLMDALGRATKLGWNIYVVDGMFRVSGLVIDFPDLPYAISNCYWHQPFEDLVAAVSRAEDAAKEKEAARVAREAALAKLTDKEKDLLGLS
jgi:hypothetical protein